MLVIRSRRYRNLEISGLTRAERLVIGRSLHVLCSDTLLALQPEPEGLQFLCLFQCVFASRWCLSLVDFLIVLRNRLQCVGASPFALDSKSRWTARTTPAFDAEQKPDYSTLLVVLWCWEFLRAW